MKTKLDFISASITSNKLDDLTLAKMFVAELDIAREKIDTIDKIADVPVKITALHLQGQDCIEKIGLTYIYGNNVTVRYFSREEFYRL